LTITERTVKFYGSVHIAPLVLHTGVASLEDHEPPYEEFYCVPLETARVVNGARRAGRRVVVALVITPERGLRVVDGLLTGLHEPHASHLAMLEALAGACHLQVAYAEALKEGYLWHEFGDLHLILP
jgi:S-adenosylmethionine:tRNA ribosyltransferase-isomerase